MARKQGSRVTELALCGVQGCCPLVKIDLDRNEVVITDDNQGKVTLTLEQWRVARTDPKLDVH